jgi:hypothetical protein
MRSPAAKHPQKNGAQKNGAKQLNTQIGISVMSCLAPN